MSKVALVLMMLLFAACAQTKSPTALSRERAAQAEKLILAGSHSAAFNLIQSDLTVLAGPGKQSPAAALFSKYPEFTNAVVAQFRADVNDATTPAALIVKGEQLYKFELNQVVASEQQAAMREQLAVRARAGNQDGTLPFLLNDNYKILPSLQGEEAQSIIFRRSLTELKKGSDEVLVGSLFNWVAERRDSPEFKETELALPQIKFTRRNLTLSVSRVFPAYAEAALARMTAHIFLEMDEADRLYREDISTALAQESSAIKVVTSPSSGDFVIKLRRLEFDERQIPERSETIMYRDYQVDILQAALLMPRNATYMYEFASGGAELSYAFTIKIEKNGEVIADELVRNRISKNYSQCRNARVQNVFGGVQPANFIANNDMRQRCAENRSGINRDELRVDVMRNIAARIASVGPIKAVTSAQ